MTNCETVGLGDMRGNKHSIDFINLIDQCLKELMIKRLFIKCCRNMNSLTIVYHQTTQTKFNFYQTQDYQKMLNGLMILQQLKFRKIKCIKQLRKVLTRDHIHVANQQINI